MVSLHVRPPLWQLIRLWNGRFTPLACVAYRPMMPCYPSVAQRHSACQPKQLSGMFCSQCGTSVANDARFCHACGRPVPFITSESNSTPPASPVGSIPPVATKHANSGEGVISRLMKPFAPNKRHSRAVSIFLLLTLVVPIFVFVFIDALDGEFHIKGTTAIGEIFWNGVIFRYLWKSFNRKGWIGALVGVAISLLVFFLGATISGNVKGERAYYQSGIPRGGPR